MKKTLSITIIGIFLMTYISIMLPSDIYAERYKMTDEKGSILMNFDYRVTDGYAEITGISSVRTDELVFPAEIEGYPVKSVRGIYLSELANLRDKITSVKFEDGIEIIDECYFSHCKNLNELYLPNTLKSGNFSFSDCTSLKKAVIPGSLEKIPKDVFSGCDNLSDVTIENGVTVIGKYAFTGCPFKSIDIPNSVYRIDDYAFNACGNLKDVKLSQSLEYIGEYAFYHAGIEQINLPSSLKEIGEQAFGYTPLKEIKLPDSLESIGYEAFKGCVSLKKANIPNKIINKPNNLFYNCSALSDITIDGEMTKEIYDHLTAWTAWGEEYAKTVSDDFVIFDGNYLASYNGKDKNPVIPDNVTVLSEQAFRNTNIDTVTFSPNIKIIPSMCFAGSHIKELVIPSTVKKVEQRAFYVCPELRKISIEDGVESIADDAFQRCRELSKENVNIGKSVKVSANAFSDTPLDKKTIENGQSATPAPTQTPNITPIKEKEKLTVTKVNNNINISVNSKNVIFPDAKPFIDDNGRTQVPVRAVAEILDAKVDWNGQTQTVTISQNRKIVKIVIGSDTMTVDDNAIKMDTNAIISEERTYIPIRFVAEALGLTVEWIEEE